MMNQQNTQIEVQMAQIAPESYCLEIKGVLEILKQKKQQILKYLQEIEEIEDKIDISIQRRWCSMFMNLFLKSLKLRNQNSSLLEWLLIQRKIMPSKQKKLEQGHVAALLRNQTNLGRDFKKQWLEFLSSKELKELIQQNHKIKQKYKTKYLNLIDKIIEESNGENPFYKFMSKHQKNERNNRINYSDHQTQIDDDIDLFEQNQSEQEDFQDPEIIYFESSQFQLYKKIKIS